jgi:hypothetical protein
MYGNSTSLNSFSSANNGNFNFLNHNNDSSPSIPLSFLQLCKSNTNPNTINEEDLKMTNLSPKYSTLDSISPSDHEKINDFNIENTNECLKNLHMIHEQNEANMHSSTSSSICSSESTTPRLNRSFLMLNRRTSLEYDNDEQSRMILKNKPNMSNNLSVNQKNFSFTDSVLQTPLNQYLTTLNNIMVANHEANVNNNSIDPNLYELYRTPNKNIDENNLNENEKIANASQYLNSNKKAENSIVVFKKENELEAILN